MTVLIYPKCSTCQKAVDWLKASCADFELRNIKDENPTYEELKDWTERSSLPLKRFFNTSGLLYKELELKDKLPTMSEDEQLRLLATDGMLVKRPLAVTDAEVIPGFKAAEWEKLL